MIYFTKETFPKVSWHKTNQILNLRRAPYSSRWAEMDEFKFFEREEKNLDGEPPMNAGKWKKESSDKMGALDAPYEKECIQFLDEYILYKKCTSFLILFILFNLHFCLRILYYS